MLVRAEIFWKDSSIYTISYIMASIYLGPNHGIQYSKAKKKYFEFLLLFLFFGPDFKTVAFSNSK